MFTFGPPPPPDVFQTQANTQFNSFMNPMNPANLNSGWGINSNYLTPSFDAPYRPQYSGSQPYGNFSRPGFFGGLNHLFNPFSRETPAWTNAVANNRPYVDSASTRPYDSMMWGMQRIVAPAVAFGLSNRILSGGGLGITGGGIGGSIGRTLGRGLFGGVAEGIGLPAAVSGGLGGFGSAVGGVLGSAAFGYAGGALLMAGAERAIFNPYINSRLTTQDLRRNFSGINFSDASGDVITGGGLSRSEAARMANQISRAGIQDMTFSTGEYRNIADLSARAGLTDNVSSRQLVQRFKDVASQVKLLMSIAKDPDIRNAIEELSKLNLAGADLTGGRNSVAANAYSGLGRFAAQAGVSIQRLMNTVGAQGQYLFQANGMTPYLGQLAAANTYAGFAAAQRTGLISPAQLARMGGLEGATQSGLTGMINAAQTPFNMMGMYNQYVLGASGAQAGGNAISTMTRFAQAAGQNPFLVMGRQALYGRMMAGRQISEQGYGGTERQILAIADLYRGMIPKNKDGNYNIEALVPIAQSIGMSPDEIMAMIQSQAAAHDPRVARQRVAGNSAFAAEQMRSYISQNGLYNGFIGQGYQAARRFGRNLTQAFADQFSLRLNGDVANTGDALERAADSWQFSGTLGHGLKLTDSSQLFSNSTDTVRTFAHRVSMPDWLRTGLSYLGEAPGDIPLYSTINRLATQEKNPDAIRLLNTKDPEVRRQLLGKLLKENRGAFGSDADRLLNVNNPKAFDLALSDISSAARTDYKFSSPQSLQNSLISDLQKITGVKSIDINSQLQRAGAIEELANAIGSKQVDASNINDFLNQKGNENLKAQLYKMSGGKSGADLMEYVENGYKTIAQTGLGSLAATAYSKHYDLETLKRNGGQGLPEKLRRQFMAAKTDQERRDILAQADVQNNANVLRDNPILGAEGMDFDKAFNLNNIQMNSRKASNQIMQALQQGRIDYGTAISTISQLDSTTTFAKAVDQFKDAVDRMPGSKPGSQSDQGEVMAAINWLGKHLFSSGSGQGTTSVAGPKGPIAR